MEDVVGNSDSKSIKQVVNEIQSQLNKAAQNNLIGPDVSGDRGTERQRQSDDNLGKNSGNPPVKDYTSRPKGKGY